MRFLYYIFALLVFFSSNLLNAEEIHINPPKNISAEERADYFQQGIRAYKERDFAIAEKNFLLMLADGFRNGDIYYNLANGFFRQNELGAAIAYYLKAKEYLPRDNDLQYNLRHARNQTKDRIEQGQWQDMKRSFLFWFHGFSGTEWMWVFVCFNVFFWGICIVRLFRKNEFVQWAFYILLVCNVVSLSCLLGKNYLKHDLAVVLEPEVSIYSGPSDAHTQLFLLHEGAELKVIDHEEAWLRIRLADRKEGWIRNDQIIRLKAI